MSRTPPGVRELKLGVDNTAYTVVRRTPPGVRELKPDSDYSAVGMNNVAPLPGCVN